MKLKKSIERYSIELPEVNENGYYEIRLESIGGLGANLIGKLLGELGTVYLRLNASSFSSYGSEKRGSPVTSFVRLSSPDREILHNSPIERPHLLALFHQALSRSQQVTAGLDQDCTLVINTSDTPRQVRNALRINAGNIYCIDALKIALECKSRMNMVMMGALVKASGFIPLDAAKQIVIDELGRKYPAMLKNNIKGLEYGFECIQSQRFESDFRYDVMPYGKEKSKWGYANAPIGGSNPHFGSTVSNDLSPSREGYIPLFLPEKCIHCGLCDTTCPDMVFQFFLGEYRGRQTMLNRGLDYHHCKGCLRCVDVCPSGALVMGEERADIMLRYFVRNKDLFTENIDLEPTGADPCITGESYLDEKRVDGGLV